MGGGRGAVGLRNDVSSRGSLRQRRRGETRVGKGKSPEVLFYGITSPYSYFEVT